MSHLMPPSRDEVLRAFAVEVHTGRDTLMRYLTRYPQYTHDLLDLSREMTRTFADNELSEEELRCLDVAVSRFRAGGGLKSAQAELKLEPKAFSAAATHLQLPLQAMLAFRERRIDLATVPARFLERLARELEAPLDQLRVFLSQTPMVSIARESKSSVKPAVAAKVSFEKVLLDAGVPKERTQALIERGE